MRLGVVLMGTGAFGAAGVGVLEALFKRDAVPCCVCGMQQGAWPAALFLAGNTVEQMHTALVQAASMGNRLLGPGGSLRRMLQTGGALSKGRKLEKLIAMQTKGKILCLCERQGMMLCRSALDGRKIIFSTSSDVMGADCVVTRQASVGYAARAAMALPPFLSPLDWMGAPLLPETDAVFACRQLFRMGAQRVLVVEPLASPHRKPDAMMLTAGLSPDFSEEELPEHAFLLRVPMPAHLGALPLDSLAACAEIGNRAAEAGLDRLLEQMGLAYGRVLPFRKTGY